MRSPIEKCVKHGVMFCCSCKYGTEAHIEKEQILDVVDFIENGDLCEKIISSN